MDAITFDVLIKRLAARRLTRLTALRGLAVGVAASLTGVSLATDEAGADRKKPKKVRICHRGDNFSIFGTTKQLKQERWQKHRRKHEADYRGRCTAEKSGLTDGDGGCGSCPATTPICSGGRCKCDVASASCVTGCCDGTSCQTGTSNTVCGADGAACRDCQFNCGTGSGGGGECVL